MQVTSLKKWETVQQSVVMPAPMKLAVKRTNQIILQIHLTESGRSFMNLAMYLAYPTYTTSKAKTQEKHHMDGPLWGTEVTVAQPIRTTFKAVPRHITQHSKGYLLDG